MSEAKAEKVDWRDDPAWRLVEWLPDCFGEPPPKPTPEAELAQPPIWASEIRDGRIVATWHRPRA